MGVLVVTFNGTSAHQVGEGEMQWPFWGEVGLSQGPHTLAHLQKQLSTLSTHSPSPGQLRAVEERARKEGGNGGVGLESFSSLLCPSAPTPSIGSTTRTQALRSWNTPSSTLGRGLEDSQESPSTAEAQALVPSLLHTLLSSSRHQTRAWGLLPSPVQP